MFTLYTTPLSANGRKVLALCEHLGLEPRIHEVNVYRGEGQAPEYLAIHPAGRIPVMVEGDFKLFESNAILQYICEVHAGYRMSSQRARERAEIASWLFWESAHWQPTLTALLAAFVGHRLAPERLPAPSSLPAWHDERLRPLLERLEDHLRDHSYLALDRLTIADLSVGGMSTYFRVAAFPFETHPNFASWYRRLEGLEAWRNSEASLWRVD